MFTKILQSNILGSFKYEGSPEKSSRKHVCIILTTSNPTFIEAVLMSIHNLSFEQEYEKYICSFSVNQCPSEKEQL